MSPNNLLVILIFFNLCRGEDKIQKEETNIYSLGPDKDLVNLLVKPYKMNQIHINRENLMEKYHYRILISYHGAEGIDAKLEFKKKVTGEKTQIDSIFKKIEEEDQILSPKDHLLKYFQTNESKLIVGEDYFVEKNKELYILELGITRPATSYDPKFKYQAVALNIELRGGDVQSEGELNVKIYFRFGYFTFVLLGICFLLVIALIYYCGFRKLQAITYLADMSKNA